MLRKTFILDNYCKKLPPVQPKNEIFSTAAQKTKRAKKYIQTKKAFKKVKYNI